MSTIAPQVGAGRMRAIAISSAQRVAGPRSTVPTWKEQNIDTVFANRRGVVGPKNIRPEQIAYWSDVLGQTVRTEEWTKAVEKESLMNHYLDSAAMGQFLDQQNDSLRAVMSKLGPMKA